MSTYNTIDQLKFDHKVYEEMLSMLNQLGHKFGTMTLRTVDGDFIIGLQIESWLAPMPADEYVEYLTSILPKSMKVEHRRANSTIYLHNVSFFKQQVAHYQQRLSEEQSTVGKSFIRQTLHGLKTA